MKQFLPLIRDVLLILILVVGILLLDRNDKMVDDYNYIYFRHSNQWVTNKLICYEVVDNGQNIKFSAENSAGDTLSYYTNMANVVLIYRNEN